MQERDGLPRRPPVYYYRKPLTLTEQLPAIGVAIGAGMAAFYIARLFLQRTPLHTTKKLPRTPPPALADRPPQRAIRSVRPAG
ncbi:MAG TPA: hypothetical protein VJ672_14200 [Gemmatimonadaceae bacterium]|nr:hypothetical protein [Gemmatimonadaceae bacterium]